MTENKPNPLTLETLEQAVSGTAAAFRCRSRLQPAGGEGDKVFPPTYSGGVYAVEERQVNGEKVPCVLLDSVQSQANRLEESLRFAWEEGRLKLPIILSDFSNVPLGEDVDELVKQSIHSIGEITTLDAPHRIADAIFRDSVTSDGDEFRDAFTRAFDANIRNATALFELCPTALVFGTWDSTGSRGGLGNKFARALVSEIVAINAVAGVRTSSRIDPLAISSKVPIYEAEQGGWTALEEEAKMTGNDKKAEPVLYKSKAGKGNPSAVNHSNVTPDIESKERSDEAIGGGVPLDYALQTSVLSLPALRRLRFPNGKGEQNGKSNDAARVVLAALGLVSIVEQSRQGYFLRSRCDLVPESLELIIERVTSATVEDKDRFALSPSGAIELLDEAVKRAKDHGLLWETNPIRLKPKPSLVAMVQKSRELELSGEATDEEGE